VGFEIEYNTKVEKPADLLKEGYDAVLVAIGAHGGVRIPVEGNQLEGVLLNIDFLRNASMGKETGMGKKVYVYGGGNVAFDCAELQKNWEQRSTSILFGSGRRNALRQNRNHGSQRRRCDSA
jgi:NADPH-dependent glutamate synthase beta subunit-like oxidoreductase